MNITKAPFTRGSHKVETLPLWQYDYGQILQITGLDLPANYEVHFANDPNGAATTALGNEDGVAIPDIYLTKGDVYAWIYLHTGEDDGETVYQIHIPVRKRASISDQPPTPVQQSIIEQAITALNSGVAAVEEAVQGIEDTIDTALQEAKDSGEFDGKDGVSPTASTSKSGKVTTLTVTDGSGTTTSEIRDGEDGDPTVLIDDTTPAANKTFSSSKVDDELTRVKSEIQEKPTTKSTDAVGVDLDITDPNGNVIARLKDGGIQTKKFDSAKADQSVGTKAESDLDIIDENLNVIARFSGGHIQTKEFDSRQLKKDIIYRNHDVTDGVYAACRWHQRYATDKQFCLLLAGDIHGDKVRLKSLVDYFNSVNAFDGAIMLGDIVGNDWSQPATFYTDEIQHSNKPFLTVLGNHDAGAGTATDQTTIMYTNIDDVYEKFFEPNLPYADLANGEHSGKNTYYYKDFTGQKIRIIVLNQYEYPADLVVDGDTKTFVYPRGQECYSQAQITWLCNTLASTPTDYGVIIALHSYPAWMLIDRDHLFTSSTIGSTNTPRLIDYSQNGFIIEEIVNAWINGTTLSESWDYTVSGTYGTSVTVDVDFTSRGTGEFVSYIGGHWHMEIVSATHKYEQPMFNAPCASLSSALQGDIPRKEGTRSEDEFTVFAVDRTAKTVKLFNIGAHYTKDGKDRQYGIYEYEGGE